VTLVRLYDSASLRVPVASVAVEGSTKVQIMVALDPDAITQPAFVGLKQSPVVVLTERVNPSVPLILIVALLLVVGVVLVGWDRLRS
jgi:hypothetical protein